MAFVAPFSYEPLSYNKRALVGTQKKDINLIPAEGGGLNLGKFVKFAHLFFLYYACDVCKKWHGYVQPPKFLINIKEISGKVHFFFFAYLYLRVLHVIISVDENCENFGKNCFRSSGKLLDQII